LIYRHTASAFCWLALSQVLRHRERKPRPRDLERKFDLIKADIASLQLNSALFSAADAGCEELCEDAAPGKRPIMGHHTALTA
jgi:hypothetical protein